MNNNKIVKNRKANFLFDFNTDLFNKQVWIVANSDNLGSVSFLKHKIREDHGQQPQICSNNKNMIGNDFDNEIIQDFKTVDKKESHFIVAGKGWYLSYEEIHDEVDDPDIFLFMEGWFENNDKCIVCGRVGQYKKYAEFYPFVIERMFKGQNHPTGLSYCPSCGMTYSTYRPNDEEAQLYYKNYRDAEYQKRRQFHEPAYTKEFNAALADPPDGGESRRNMISDFLIDVIKCDQIKNILDYGGDRGQFIPSVFQNAQKYVYDISGARTEENVTGIISYAELRNCNIQWDLILCNQCLEHLSDVYDYFNRLVECMSEKTYLYIEVPNERSILNSYTVKIHEHINMFSQNAFHILAEKNGLRVIKSTDTSGVRCLLKK